MTLYATGARRAKVAHLKNIRTSTDNAWSFTSARQQRVQDRDVVLRSKLLEVLRDLLAAPRRKPTDLALSRETMAHGQVLGQAQDLLGRLVIGLPHALGWLVRSKGLNVALSSKRRSQPN